MFPLRRESPKLFSLICAEKSINGRERTLQPYTMVFMKGSGRKKEFKKERKNERKKDINKERKKVLK